jgi:hypothetical protein
VVNEFIFKVSVEWLVFKSYQKPAKLAEFHDALSTAEALTTEPLISTEVAVTAALAGNDTKSNIKATKATIVIFLLIFSFPPYFIWYILFSFEICRSNGKE